MELKKIEGILTALGYIEGTIEQIKVDETADGLNISFHANKKIERCRENPDPVEERVRTEEIKTPDPKITYPIKVTNVPKTTQEEPKKEKSDYKKSHNRSMWKTPVPRTTKRYIYFKDRKTADRFANEYREEFELIDSEINHDKAVRCELRNTNKNEPMYYEGYPWCLSFRMNGAAFEVLENCEGLKRRPGGKRGGACIRLKD